MKWIFKIVNDYDRKYRRANNRLFLLDYDGTMVEKGSPSCISRVTYLPLFWFFFKTKILEVEGVESPLFVHCMAGSRAEIMPNKPDEKVIELLDKLCRDERNTVYILSGKTREMLESWFHGYTFTIPYFVFLYCLWNRATHSKLSLSLSHTHTSCLCLYTDSVPGLGLAAEHGYYIVPFSSPPPLPQTPTRAGTAPSDGRRTSFKEALRPVRRAASEDSLTSDSNREDEKWIKLSKWTDVSWLQAVKKVNYHLSGKK